MTDHIPSELLEHYLGLESFVVTEELLDLCGARIDMRALPMLKRRAEEAITLLLKEQRPINFKTVAQTAQISTAWLYAHEEIKMRVIHLRSQQAPSAQVKIPPREQASSASKDAVIVALKTRIREQAEEIKDLKKQLEVAYGSLYKQ